MPNITFPALTTQAPANIDWQLISNSKTVTSPLTQAVQTISYAGARWAFSCTFDTLPEAEAAIIQSFLVQLRGQANRFFLHPFQRPIPRGTQQNSILVNGAGQTGTTLICSGATPSATLLAGDFFSVNGELKMLIANAAATGTGAITLNFEPPLRRSPAANSIVSLQRPQCLFMLQDSKVSWQTRGNNRLSSITLSAVEAFS